MLTLKNVQKYYEGFHLNCSNLSINRIKVHVAKYPYGYHEVVKLCNCEDDSQ